MTQYQGKIILDIMLKEKKQKPNEIIPLKPFKLFHSTAEQLQTQNMDTNDVKANKKSIYIYRHKMQPTILKNEIEVHTNLIFC